MDKWRLNAPIIVSQLSMYMCQPLLEKFVKNAVFSLIKTTTYSSVF